MGISGSKVLVPLCGVPVLERLLRQLALVHQKFPARIGLIVGHARDEVEAWVRSQRYPFEVEFLYQAEQKGTGHAVQEALRIWREKSPAVRHEQVLILAGDTPLVRPELLEQMWQQCMRKPDSISLVSTHLADPSGYGRIVRDDQGNVNFIIEEKDATQEQRVIQEVNVSLYRFPWDFLLSHLGRLTQGNAQNEYYLTDLIRFARSEKYSIEVVSESDSLTLCGLNSPRDWRVLQQELYRRKLDELESAGVRVHNRETVRIDPEVTVGRGSEIESHVSLLGGTVIGANCLVESGSRIRDSEIASGVHIKQGSVVDHSKIAENVVLGPYAHLRPGSSVGNLSKIGNFVELKKSQIGSNTSIAHLSYLGDATVGDRVNIGCGFVTCNFDGRVIHGSRKHPSIIEDDVFMGSDCQVIAPIRVGRGSYVASGSTLSEDVPEGALAIARSRQMNKAGYAETLKKKSQKSNNGE